MTNLLQNRYQIIEQLGSGGFGETFIAQDLSLPSHRKCVVKQLKPISDDPRIYQLIQERFQKETITLEKLGQENPQIPTLYAYFVENDQFYLVQEYIEGVTLTKKIET